MNSVRAVASRRIGAPGSRIAQSTACAISASADQPLELRRERTTPSSRLAPASSDRLPGPAKAPSSMPGPLASSSRATVTAAATGVRVNRWHHTSSATPNAQPSAASRRSESTSGHSGVAAVQPAPRSDHPRARSPTNDRPPSGYCCGAPGLPQGSVARASPSTPPRQSWAMRADSVRGSPAGSLPAAMVVTASTSESSPSGPN